MKLLPGNWKKEEMDCRKLAIIEPVVEGRSKFINTSLRRGIFWDQEFELFGRLKIIIPLVW